MEVCMCRASFSFPLLISAKKTRISFIFKVFWKLNFCKQVLDVEIFIACP